MKNRKEITKIAQEYLSFKETDDNFVPRAVSETTRSLVLDRLNPGGFLIFRKLIVIHGFFGFLSLAICHQMGMNPFGTRFSIHSVLMDVLGHMGCSVFCGFWFIGGSISVSYFILSREEFRALKNREWAQNLLLSLVSLVIFSLFGAELLAMDSLLWFLGALLGGILATRLFNRRLAV